MVWIKGVPTHASHGSRTYDISLEESLNLNINWEDKLLEFAIYKRSKIKLENIISLASFYVKVKQEYLEVNSILLISLLPFLST